MKQQHISRAGRKAQIMLSIFERLSTETNPVFTPYAIAKELGIKPSTHVKKIVNELVSDGWLNQREQQDLWGRTKYVVWLTTDAFNLLMDTFETGNNNLKFVKSWFE